MWIFKEKKQHFYIHLFYQMRFSSDYLCIVLVPGKIQNPHNLNQAQWIFHLFIVFYIQVGSKYFKAIMSPQKFEGSLTQILRTFQRHSIHVWSVIHNKMNNALKENTFFQIGIIRA